MNGDSKLTLLAYTRRVLARLIRLTAVVFVAATAFPSFADQLISDDLVVKGSICIGLDCASGENFTFDTIRMKENNVRIRFTDTSSSSSFPTRDWEITANDSTNGGNNKFSIFNVDNNKTPFTILDNASENALYIHTADRVGFGTSAPLMQLHVVTGNSPTLRLDQDQSSGFAAQAWDVSGNETNFFVRDVTNNGTLPLRITSGAPNAALFVAADGDVGFETTTPDGQFDIAHATDANNHAVLVNAASLFGINIDNGFNPRGWLDVQTTGGVSRLLVETDGDVGIGMGTSDTASALFHVRSTGGASDFKVTSDGDAGIGSFTGDHEFELYKDNVTMSIFDSSDSAVTDANPDLLQLDAKYSANIKYINRTFTGKDWTMGPSVNNGAFVFSRSDYNDGDSSLINDAIISFSPESGGQILLRDTSAVELFKFDNGDITITGMLNSGSSRTFKENIQQVDGFSMLEKLLQLPIATWRYKKDSENEPLHIGPIAEDFYALFGFGSDEKHIASNDVIGVAVASIQALNQQLEAKEQELQSLKKQYQMLNDRMLELERIVSKNSQ